MQACTATHPSACPDTPDLQTLTEEIFKPKGLLHNALNLEFRPEQSTMACSVAQGFTEETPLLFEAGTGVGKSLAYLIPGILKAVQEERPFVVSTHTKSLQEQILTQDLELCRKLFQSTPELEPFQDFKAALLVGRGNYLCTTRLAQALQSHIDLFPSADQQELERIAQWAETTETGLIEELMPQPSFNVWNWVHADSTTCNPKRCSPKTCFYQKARIKQRKAHVIILNHSLLFSLISAGQNPEGSTPGILYPEDFLVLDEAHTVPDIARDHFGVRISAAGIFLTLKMLFNPKRNKGILTNCGSTDDLAAVTMALSEAEAFFDAVHERFLEKKKISRISEPDWIDTRFCNTLKNLIQRLASLTQRTSNEALAEEIQNQCKRLQGYHSGLLRCITLEESDSVFWAETSGKNTNIPTLRSAPIDVASYLEKVLFARHTSVLLTSATLAQGNSMTHFCEQVGAQGFSHFIEKSPFDFERNTQIYIATDAPDPSPRESRLDTDYLLDTLSFCIEQVSGGTLILFTSYADMYRIGPLLEERLVSSPRPVFIQGKRYSRHELIQEFKKAGNAVLLGTDSFWTGIDIPGAALSQVIITRLPFENPSHPIKQAFHEWLRLKGGNPFMDITLPEALIKFRQGLGRLVRNKADTGIITLLDGRLFRKSYGKYFLDVLPRQGYRRFNEANRELVFNSSD